MEETTRAYSGKDAEMLIAASVITENAIANKAFLITKRPTWVDPFFPNLKTKIDNAVQTYLGADNAKSLRLATQALMTIEKNALRDLAEFKVALEVDYDADKSRLKEILTQLGFASYYKQAKGKDQEAVINQLFQFKANMINTLQTEIVAKGGNPAIITAIIGYANTLKASEVSQETFKGTRKTATEAAIKEFNACYKAVIGVCKISANIYKDVPDLKKQFSYTKVLASLSTSGNNATPPAPVTPP